MKFSECKAAVLYFRSDKSFAVYPASEIIGWNEKQFDALVAGERPALLASYGLSIEKVSTSKCLLTLLALTGIILTNRFLMSYCKKFPNLVEIG